MVLVRLCVSNWLPGDTDAALLRTTLWAARPYTTGPPPEEDDLPSIAKHSRRAKTSGRRAPLGLFSQVPKLRSQSRTKCLLTRCSMQIWLKWIFWNVGMQIVTRSLPRDKWVVSRTQCLCRGTPITSWWRYPNWSSVLGDCPVLGHVGWNPNEIAPMTEGRLLARMV